MFWKKSPRLFAVSGAIVRNRKHIGPYDKETSNQGTAKADGKDMREWHGTAAVMVEGLVVVLLVNMLGMCMIMTEYSVLLLLTPRL